MTMHAPVGDEELRRLRWRSRRGLLECDLFVARFFDRHAHQITRSQADGFTALMALDDPPLLDLLLARAEPEHEVNTAEVREVLALMRVAR